MNIVDGYSHLPLGHCALTAGHAASHWHITRAAPNMLKIFGIMGIKENYLLYKAEKPSICPSTLLVVCIYWPWLHGSMSDLLDVIRSYVFWHGEIYFKSF